MYNGLMSESREKIVILGAGYAGMSAYRELKKKVERDDGLEITLINDSDYMLFAPLIYEVAAANLVPSAVRASIRSEFTFARTSFIQARVKRLDYENQKVYCQLINSKRDEFEISYDYLLSALGAQTNYFGLENIKKNSYSLKSLEDAISIRNRIIECFRLACVEEDEQIRHELLTFTVIGGGPTGVTLAAKIADLLEEDMCRAFPRAAKESRVVIVEAGDRLVRKAGDKFSQTVTRKLAGYDCIDLVLNCRVKEVGDNGVVAENRFISSKTIIWTAGVRANEIEAASEESINQDKRSQRIKTTNHLNLSQHPNVFVAGDQAWVYDKEHEQPYPMRAQFAVRQGRLAARNILAQISGKSLQEFYWQDKGMIVSLGHKAAVAKVFGLTFSGPLATLLYKLTGLYAMPSARSRWRAIVDWTLNIFTSRDIAEI